MDGRRFFVSLLGAAAFSFSAVSAAPAAPPAADGGAAPSAPAGDARSLDAREVIVPLSGAERLRIDNPLGSVTVRAWERRDAMHIIAEKRASTAEALGRLRVHYTAWASGEISLESRV